VRVVVAGPRDRHARILRGPGGPGARSETGALDRRHAPHVRARSARAHLRRRDRPGPGLLRRLSLDADASEAARVRSRYFSPSSWRRVRPRDSAEGGSRLLMTTTV